MFSELSLLIPRGIPIILKHLFRIHHGKIVNKIVQRHVLQWFIIFGQDNISQIDILAKGKYIHWH
jgi:hypothetical protein